MSELVLAGREDPLFVHYVKRRIKRNKNFLAVITGPTGSGKTYSSLRLAEQIDPRFNIGRVCFTPAEFMSQVNANLPSGSVIVYDEAGVSLGHRDWMSKTNKMLNYVIQTFRHRNLVVLFTLPDFGFLDASTRKLAHALLETHGIMQKEKAVRLKPLFLSYNQRSGKMYNTFLKVIVPDGNGGSSIEKLKWIKVGMPSKKLVSLYEAKKKQFTDELNDQIMSELSELSGDLTKAQEEVLSLLKARKKVYEIAEVLEIDKRVVYGHMQSLRNKGYKIQAVKEGSKVEYYEVSVR